MASVLRDIGRVLDFGTGAYDGILEGTEDWINDPTGKKAAAEGLDKQLEFAQRGIDTQREMYDQSRSDLQPFYDIGLDNFRFMNNNSGSLMDTFTMEDFMADPGYQFRLQEGEKAINRAMASKGLRNSTAAVKSLNDYNQGMASSEFDRAYNRFNSDRDQRWNKLSGLAGVGTQMAGNMANTATNFGSNISDIYQGMGNAYAAEAMNRANFNQGVTGQAMDIGGMIGGMAMCDERVKTDIEPISEKDLSELREAIKPYKFKYAKDLYGEGDWVGPMAQDLEKTKLGQKLVFENSEGIKMIDMNQVGLLILATMGKGA